MTYSPRASYKTAARRQNAQRIVAARGLRPTARELFPELRRRLLDSRPVISVDPISGPVYGPPTYRNVVVDGHVV